MEGYRIFERQTAQHWRDCGYYVIDLNNVRRNFPGCDLLAIKIDPLTFELVGNWYFIECKSGRTANSARLTPTQKRMLEKYKERYYVKRNPYYRNFGKSGKTRRRKKNY